MNIVRACVCVSSRENYSSEGSTSDKMRQTFLSALPSTTIIVIEIQKIKSVILPLSNTIGTNIHSLHSFRALDLSSALIFLYL